MKLLLTIPLLACTVSSTIDQCFDADRPLIPMRDPSINQLLLRSQLDFSLALLRAVQSTHQEDSVFLSPLSIFNTLMLTYFVSRGHTEDSLKRALFLPIAKSKTDMLLSYRLQRILSLEVYKSQVRSSNRLFLSREQTVSDCAADIFGDEVQRLDFSPGGIGRSVSAINDWVTNVTSGNIRDLVSADSLSPSTQLIVANAAYFKSLWKNQFDEKDTRMDRFFVKKGKSVSAPMMFQHKSFSYTRSNELAADVLELLYQTGDISMILILPDSTQSISALLQRLDSNTLLGIVRGLNTTYDIDVKLPKFTIERFLQLTPILEGLGVGDLFQSTSNLTGLTGGPRIRLNDAIHKAKIQLDEKGSEASAATAFTDTRIPSEAFICDRPFLYLIYDKTRATLPFAGVLYDPTKQ